MFRLAVLSIVSIALVVSGIPERSFRITGGYLAKVGQIPFQAAVLNNSYLICGGTIISPKVVVTAAHCMMNENKQISVLVGATNLVRGGGEIIPIERYLSHENFVYHPFLTNNDISLLFLSKTLTYSDRIQPAKLPLTYDDYHNSNAIATVSGWGIEKEKGIYSEVLKFTHVQLIPRAECLRRVYFLSWNVICAGSVDGKKDACSGDSGGPLFINDTLVGIVSFGYRCGETTKPGGYADVPKLRSWIRTNAGV